MKIYMVLFVLLFTTAFAQDCQTPTLATEPPGQSDELTDGFPEALDTPQKRQAILTELLANFLEYYDNDVVKQNRDDFKAKVTAATSEHEFYTVIREWVAALAEKDNRSSFSSPRELAALGSDDAPFAGVGMTVNGPGPQPFLIVLSVRPDGPADLAGIKPRDRILAIDGEGCPEISKIRGEEGTEVTLTVQSPNEEPRDLTLTRMLFTSYSRAYSKLAFRLEQEPTIGYFYVSDLALDETDTTDKDILAQLAERGVKSHQKTLEGLILDVRNGSYGYAGTLIQFLDHFTSGNRFILRTGLGSDERFFARKQEPDLRELPLAVIIDETTTVVGVWLAAVLKERPKTVLVGQATSPFPIAGSSRTLNDGSEIFFPSVTFLVNKGTDLKSNFVELENGVVTPDVLVEGDGSAFAFDDDPFIKAALEELAKLEQEQ